MNHNGSIEYRKAIDDFHKARAGEIAVSLGFNYRAIERIIAFR